jgi:hypothetical protein
MGGELAKAWFATLSSGIDSGVTARMVVDE